VPLAADVGHTIRVRDTVTVATAGLQNWADSAATGVVAGGAPVNLSPPVIAGTAATGQSLSVTPGIWSTSDITRSFQWRRCDSAGANCNDVVGASTSYALAAADVGHTVRVGETASNPYGTASANSAPTAVVRSTPGGIAGQVTDGNKKLIAGATVGCGAAGTTTTNANGGYSLMMVPPGTYKCTAGASGYTANTQTVTVKEGYTTTANFSLARSWTRPHARLEGASFTGRTT
jgi:hypothetical protein